MIWQTYVMVSDTDLELWFHMDVDREKIEDLITSYDHGCHLEIWKFGRGPNGDRLISRKRTEVRLPEKS